MYGNSLFTLAVFLVGMALLSWQMLKAAGAETPSQSGMHRSYSSYNFQQTGSGALFRTLHHFRPEIKPWTEPVRLLVEKEPQGTLLVWDLSDINYGEKKLLEEWDGQVIEVGGLESINLHISPQSAVSKIQQILAAPGPLFFDEYHLGLHRNPGLFPLCWEMISTGWGRMVAQMLLVGVIYLLFCRITIDRFACEPIEVEGSTGSTLRLIRSRAALFQEAKAYGLAERALTGRASKRPSEENLIRTAKEFNT